MTSPDEPIDLDLVIRHTSNDGARRLLLELVHRGVRCDAIVAAAALCAALDRPNASDNEAKAA